MASKRTILVTGATGRQGGATLKHLKERGYPVRVLTRDPNKPAARALVKPGIEVVRGDYDDPASLARALEGVYGVFSVQTVNPEEVRQGKLLADLAQRAEVRHFVYASVASADQDTGIPHFETKWQIENHIRNIGIPHTILRPVFFMENFISMAGSLAQGVLAQPLRPDLSLQSIAVDDIGAFATLAFEHPAQWLGKAMDLAGDAPTVTEMVEMLGRATGRPIQYQQISWDDFERAAGHDMTLMMHWFENVGYHADIPALRQLYPRLTSFQRWVQTQDWKRVLGVQAKGA